MSECDAWEQMGICQQGDLMGSGHHTGAVCRKPSLCRAEGRCYFVARARAHFEQAERLGVSPFGWLRDPKPHKPRFWRSSAARASDQADQVIATFQEHLL